MSSAAAKKEEPTDEGGETFDDSSDTLEALTNGAAEAAEEASRTKRQTVQWHTTQSR